jgi:tetratricopeptide (TPR) repeat protein
VTSTVLSVSLFQARSLSAEGRDVEAVDCLVHALGGPANDPSEEREARDLHLHLLLRCGRYVEALEAAGHALGGEAVAPARARLLSCMSYAYAQLSAHEEALKCASATVSLALADGDSVTAARGLECIGICYASLGDCPKGERFMFEALGMAMQTSDASAIMIRLSNAMYLSCLLHDAYQADGDADLARVALERCTRFIARAEKLLGRVGLWEQCLWRSNRAGWLRRRGEVDRAVAEYDVALADARLHGWRSIAAVGSYELALAACARGEIDAALDLLRGIPTGREDALDSFDVSLRAHRLMRDVLTMRGEIDAALSHDAACVDLILRRNAQRADVTARLGRLSDSVLDALADPDRTRIDAEIARLRELAGQPVTRLYDDRRA